MTALLHVVLFEPPARTSNKFEGWLGMSDTAVTIVSDREGWGTDDVIVLPARRVPLIGSREGWAAAPAWLRGLDRLDHEPIDVVVSHELYSFSTYQASCVARHRGAVHLVHISETLPRNPVYRVPPYAQLTRRAIRSVDWFVCTTERARLHTVELGADPNRISVAHSGVDATLFTPRPGGRAVQPTVLFVGMLRANRGADKGVLDLVTAMDSVHASRQDARLVLVGEGHLRPQLEAMARERSFLEVRHRVRREEVPDLMRSARAFSLPSKRTWKWEEQFGFVLVEAMASGLPVVATTSGAIPEIVPPWNPLVPEGDRRALTEGLLRALGPAGDEWGRQNRRWVEQRLTLRQQSQSLRAAVDAAIAARGSTPPR